MITEFVVNAALKVEARNIVNIEEIDKYVQSLLDRAKTDNVKRWLKKTFRKYLINNYQEVEKVSEPKKSYPDYINDAIKSGQDVFIVTNLDALEIYSVIDYLNTLDEINFGYEQALKKSKEWHKDLAQNAGTYGGRIKDRSKIIKTYDNGYSWRKLVTKKDFILEGDRMGHCVGSYDPEDFHIYSLRKPNNEPKVTVELSPKTPHVIGQVKGKANTVPKKYKKYVVDFMQNVVGLDNIKLKDPEKDLRKLGITIINGKFIFSPKEIVGLKFNELYRDVKTKKIDLVDLADIKLVVDKQGIVLTAKEAFKNQVKIKTTSAENFKLKLLKLGWYIDKAVLKEINESTILPKSYVTKRERYLFYINTLLLGKNIPLVSVDNETLQHTSTVKSGDFKTISNVLLSMILDANRVITEKGVVSFSKAAKEKLPIYDGEVNNVAKYAEGNPGVSIFLQNKYILYKTDAMYVMSLKEALNIVTENRTKIFTIPQEMVKPKTWLDEFLNKLWLKLPDIAEYADPYEDGVEISEFGVVIAGTKIVPFSKLTGKEASIDMLHLKVGKEFTEFSPTFWKNYDSNMTVTDTKLEIDDLDTDAGIDFVRCEIKAGNISCRQFLANKNTSIVADSIETIGDCWLHDCKAKTIIAMHDVIVEDKLVVEHLETAMLEAEDATIKIGTWKSDEVATDFQANDSKISIDKFEGSNLALHLNRSTVNGETDYRTIKKLLMGQHLTWQEKLTVDAQDRTIGYLRFDNYIAAIKWNKTEMPVKKAVTMVGNKPHWLVHIKLKRKIGIFEIKYLTKKELNKFLSEEQNTYMGIKRKIMELNPNITLNKADQSLFSETKRGLEFTKYLSR